MFGPVRWMDGWMDGMEKHGDTVTAPRKLLTNQPNHTNPNEPKEVSTMTTIQNTSVQSSQPNRTTINVWFVGSFFLIMLINQLVYV